MWVRLNIDHASVGCGVREFLVLRSGRKWVRLLYLATMTAFTLPREDFDKAKPLELAVRGVDKVIMRRRIRANGETFHATKKLIQTALAAVRAL